MIGVPKFQNDFNDKQAENALWSLSPASESWTICQAKGCPPLTVLPDFALDFSQRSRRISDCLLSFQLAWEYLLFDNRVKQARTRLVSRFLVRVYRIRGQ